MEMIAKKTKDKHLSIIFIAIVIGIFVAPGLLADAVISFQQMGWSLQNYLLRIFLGAFVVFIILATALPEFYQEKRSFLLVAVIILAEIVSFWFAYSVLISAL